MKLFLILLVAGLYLTSCGFGRKTTTKKKDPCELKGIEKALHKKW